MNKQFSRSGWIAFNWFSLAEKKKKKKSLSICDRKEQRRQTSKTMGTWFKTIYLLRINKFAATKLDHHNWLQAHFGPALLPDKPWSCHFSPLPSQLPLHIVLSFCFGEGLRLPGQVHPRGQRLLSERLVGLTGLFITSFLSCYLWDMVLGHLLLTHTHKAVQNHSYAGSFY